MAYTRAKQVAEKITSVLAGDAVVSIGRRSSLTSTIEVVVTGYRHPDDGISRVWHIELHGQSGLELQLAITALRKIGFYLFGSAPLMGGRLTQVLSQRERAAVRAQEKEIDQRAERAQEKASILAETVTVKREANHRFEALIEEISELKTQVSDLSLVTPRPKTGPAGKDGKDGKDGRVEELSRAELDDLGDVSSETPEEGMVLTFLAGQWRPRQVPTSSPLIMGSSGSSGGGSSSDGLSAYEIAAAAGYTGTEEEWLASLSGSDGMTAYEIAAEEGFTGTQAEWVASLSSGSSLQYWTEDENGNLIPSGQGTQSLGSETNRVKELSVSGQTIKMGGLDLNIRAADSRLMFNGDLLAVGGEVPASIDELNDVDVVTVAPVVGQTLLWDGSNWIPGAVSGGGVADAPIDGNAYVRISGQWMLLSHAIQALVDAADFTTGDSGAITHAQLDGGNYITGASDAGEPSGQNGSNGGNVP